MVGIFINIKYYEPTYIIQEKMSKTYSVSKLRTVWTLEKTESQPLGTL